MNCYKCGKTGKNRTDNKVFCDKCFIEVIEKRVRKEIRIQNLIGKSDKILILDDSSDAALLNMYFLKKIIQSPNVKISIKKIKIYDDSKNYDEKKEYTKIAAPLLLDDEAEKFLESFFKNKKTDFLHKGKKIKPAIGITRDEAKVFLKIKNIDYREKNPGEISEMMDRLEKKYPGTKFGILKSIRNMEEK